MKTKSFTFKKRPRETGLRSVGHIYQSVDIKLAGKCIGWISAPSYRREGWGIWFHVRRTPTAEYLSPFENKKLKGVFDSEDEARAYLKENAGELMKLDFYAPFDEE